MQITELPFLGTVLSWNFTALSWLKSKKFSCVLVYFYCYFYCYFTIISKTTNGFITVVSIDSQYLQLCDPALTPLCIGFSSPTKWIPHLSRLAIEKLTDLSIPISESPPEIHEQKFLMITWTLPKSTEKCWLLLKSTFFSRLRQSHITTTNFCSSINTNLPVNMIRITFGHYDC